MDTNVQNNVMKFEGKEVEVFEWNGKVLFNPRHVGECLGLGESAVRMATSKMNEKQVIKLTNLDVKEIDIRKLNNAGENFLTESGIYKLIFKSHKEEAERFQDWVTDDVLPSIRKTGSYSSKKKVDPAIKEKEIEARLKNAKAREANVLLKIASNPNLSEEYVQVLQSKATEIITGEAILPLPIAERKTYSAEEIGKQLGISGNKVGRMANKYNLKTDEYGKYYHDKSKYSSKEVESFRYYDSIIPVLRKLLELEG